MAVKTERKIAIGEKTLAIIGGVVGILGTVWAAGVSWEHLGSSITAVDNKYKAKHEEAMQAIQANEAVQKEFRQAITKRVDSMDTKLDTLAAGMYRLEGAAGTRPSVSLEDYLKSTHTK